MILLIAGLMHVALSFVAVVAVVLALGGLFSDWGRRRVERGRDFQRKLHLDSPPALAVWGAPGAGIVLALLVTAASGWILGLVVGFLTYKVLDAAPQRAVARRMHKFDEQLVDMLVGLANSLKAGLTLPQAVEQIAKGTPAPMCEEMNQVVSEYKLGKTIEQAFEDVADRIDSRNFNLAVTAFRVGKERGGNVAMVFERIGKSIQEIWRLEEFIRTKTTEGRSSARFMTFMPGVFLLLLYFMDPEGIQLLFTDPVGNAILAAAIFVNLVGHFWIRRVLAVDV